MGILRIGDFKELISTGKDLIIVDARGGADAYQRFEASHVADAVYADLENNLSHKSENAANGGRHPLPSPYQFSQFLSEKGIWPSSSVVIYDDKNGANAASRMWWMLKAAGHEKVYVLDGGIQAALAQGIRSETGPERPVTKSTYTFEEWLKPMATMEQVAKAATDNQFLVIDVRENYRYKGESEPIDLVAGHIPGAVNMPYTGNLNEEGQFLDSHLLQEKYRDLIGNRSGENIYVHCGSGVTACHTLLALSDAGFNDAVLYVGSWSEWSRNDKPVGRNIQ
jgi:thiosulfate/3-mercaptopyruvate sulfurtransferase